MPKEINRIIQTLNKEYLQMYPAEASRALGKMKLQDIAGLLEKQPIRQALNIWEQLPPDLGAQILTKLHEPFAKDFLAASDPIASCHALTRLPSEVRERFLGLLEGSKKREITELLQYPESSAGSVMDTRFPILYENITVRDALKLLRKRRPRFTRHLFLLDDEGNLRSMIEIQELALSGSSNRISSIAKPVAAAVLPTASMEEVVEQLEKLKLADLPVIDVTGKLVGVIRYSALVSAVREDSSADILTMVGVSRNERALSKIGFVIRKRLPWLQLNLLTAFLAAAVVGLFEGTIAKFTALAVLLPVVAGQSGNAGAQALAVTMRGLALHEISTVHWRKVAAKEIGAGLVNGIAIALTTMIGVMVWSSSAGLAMVIGLSMVVSMVAAALSGVVIPMFLSSVGQDPAQSSSIILTTITDVVGFLTFLGIATIFVGML